MGRSVKTKMNKNIDFEDQKMDLSEDSESEKRNYLNYGLQNTDFSLNLTLPLCLLDETLPKENRLTQARERQSFSRARMMSYYSRYCDFCGLPMSMNHAETTVDGRIRCADCSAAQIQEKEEFQKLYEECRTNFQAWFGQLPEGIEIRQSVLKEPGESDLSLGISFYPYLNARMGQVLYEKDHYVIEIAAGASRLANMYALVSCFAQIWISINWDMKKLDQMCQATAGQKAGMVFIGTYHGMRLWTGVEYLYLVNERLQAQKIDQTLMMEDVPEAKAYSLYKRTYPFRTNKRLALRHPFAKRVPIDIETLASAIDLEKMAEQNQT